MAHPLRCQKALSATVLITVHPDLVSRDVLAGVDTVMALGPEADKVVESFCAAVGEDVSAAEIETVVAKITLGIFARMTLAFLPGTFDRDRPCGFGCRPVPIQDLVLRWRHDALRHGALNLKAQNLMMFLQIAEGIDDRTWEHHLRAGDYSAWFSNQVKDKGLAEEAAVIEDDDSLDPNRSRAAIAEAIHRRYTAPAD